MTDTQAVTTIPVSRVCDDGRCERPADVATIVTGEYGPDDIAAYCDECAAKRDDSDNHTHVGTVERGNEPLQNE